MAGLNSVQLAILNHYRNGEFSHLNGLKRIKAAGELIDDLFMKLSCDYVGDKIADIS